MPWAGVTLRVLGVLHRVLGVMVTIVFHPPPVPRIPRTLGHASMATGNARAHRAPPWAPTQVSSYPLGTLCTTPSTLCSTPSTPRTPLGTYSSKHLPPRYPAETQWG